ncbi:MFS transporter [Bradyrhizobium elkanii]|uniref:Sugar phosphate permease n=2 Tax=Bradyrhizobium elkanii TaxID=29448 RepID=A0ABV4EWQ5_BRAEL|nr:MFS transporter [Bradyrhizobium elkanii]MCP1756507.1 sugar phosphate permease [Bradyrhizobium elkanii]MCP1982020.1 sugar phosphate permease [Bradyrhizobium elkanii]MCS3883196.1 sugar phosphate permease [Bradyrhizobium elkanii]MCS4217747.1 sugar phosphate permease [Bradyrhizobium elkanii]MCW2195803.1 sugar phosphate permease [Bradyrhizobium elkanii]
MQDAAHSRLYGRIAWRLIPFLLACYTVAIIDRFNIGFAKLQFLHDLQIDDAVFGLAAGIFSVGYVALEVPSNLLLVKVGVRKTLLRIMVLWGVVTMLLALVQNQYHLYLLRFLLGAAEGGFFPGILYYLTLWFPDRVRGRMTSLFVMAVPLGGVIAGPLSGLIMDHMQGVHGLHGWQWLFILEGGPAVLLGIAAYFYLADGPQVASWLSADERRQVASDLARDRAAVPGTTRSFAAALREPRVYLLSFIYFAFFCSLNTILLWTPTLLKHVGVATTTEIGWLSGAISVASAIGMVAIGYSSDRTRERRWHVVCCGLVAAACFIALQAAQDSVLLTVTLLAVASIGIFAILSLFWTIPNAMLEGSAAAGGIALISAIGSFGGAVCPALIGWMNVATGSIYAPLALVGTVLGIGMLTLIVCVPRTRHEVTLAEPSRP